MKKQKIEIPAHLKRVNFFDGQLLTAVDFQAEQEYFINRMRLQNLICHGPGIISGLEVSIREGTHSAVIVSPGVAVDPHGNLITLPQAQQASLPEKANTVYIVIYWAERETDFVPVPSGGDEGETVALRVEEYAILKREPKRSDASRNGITLARLKKTRGKWILAKLPHTRRANA